MREHASEREKLITTAEYYENATGELDKAVQTWEEIESYYPGEPLVYASLGLEYAEQGQYEGPGDLGLGIRLLPDSAVLYKNMANYALALQRFDEARQFIHVAQARKDEVVVRASLYALAFLGSDSAAMAEQQQWFAGKPEENLGLALASDTEAYGGHLAKARELA